MGAEWARRGMCGLGLSLQEGGIPSLRGKVCQVYAFQILTAILDLHKERSHNAFDIKSRTFFSDVAIQQCFSDMI
jgi:hypothetical protein